MKYYNIFKYVSCLLLTLLLAPHAVAEEPIKKSVEKETTTPPLPIEILDLVLTTQVKSREPVDAVDNFQLKDSQRAFAFVRLSSKQSQALTFVWTRNGKVISEFTTQVHAAKQWRTFSSVRLKPGPWSVQLRLGEMVLAQQNFTVEK